jgi:methionyl-tRNA synthetase
VHDYLTAGGRKISKSAGALSAASEPTALAARYGADAVRWWLLREVPRVGDADFTVERLIARAEDELANGFGNLVRPAATDGCRVLPRCSGGCRWRRRQGVLNRQARVPAGSGSAG